MENSIAILNHQIKSGVQSINASVGIFASHLQSNFRFGLNDQEKIPIDHVLFHQFPLIFHP